MEMPVQYAGICSCVM